MKLSGGKVISKLDLSEAYLQIPVDMFEVFKIKMRKDLYSFNWLPFGI